jgi:CheY-like chemotaxis protein
MDGYQVLKALQADETLRSLPVVVVTVHDARHIAMSLGARSFLTKPVDRDALQLALSECCEKPSEMAATA